MAILTNKKIQEITISYYSCFTCYDLNKLNSGLTLICDDRRNETLKGYSGKFTIYALIKDDKCVVAYTSKYKDFFINHQNDSINSLINSLTNTFLVKKMQLMVFDKEKVFDYGNAQILKKEDYPLYEKFFCLDNPSSDPKGWLKDYFESKLGYFVGYFINDEIVSLSDTPDMAYLESKIQHTGISTLKDYRHLGYGKKCAALNTFNLLQKGIVPQYECEYSNIASIGLAESVGYKKYGEALILEEE